MYAAPTICSPSKRQLLRRAVGDHLDRLGTNLFAPMPAQVQFYTGSAYDVTAGMMTIVCNPRKARHR